MLRSGRTLGRKITSAAPRCPGQRKTPVSCQKARHPTVNARESVRKQIRSYGSADDSRTVSTPASAMSDCIKPPLNQASPISHSAQIFQQKSSAAKPPPFDQSTQALFDNLYSKLPLDHTKYKTIVEVANDYALLSLGNNYVLRIKCSMLGSQALTFPLHPDDATRILASGQALKTHVQDLRENLNSRYIFSLEGVDKMRRALDPDYPPS